MRPATFSPPRRRALLKPPRLPILTLDEQKLTPSMGYVFNKRWLDPCESLVSILWKFEKVNALPGNVVARVMGPDIDPYEGVIPQLGGVALRDYTASSAFLMRRSRSGCCTQVSGASTAHFFVTVAVALRAATIAWCTRCSTPVRRIIGSWKPRAAAAVMRPPTS